MHSAVAENGPEAPLIEAVRIRIDAVAVQIFHVDELIADLIRGIGELYIELAAGHGEGPEDDGKAVAAHDGKDDAHILAAQLLPHIGRDLFDGGVIALSPGDNRFGDPDHIPVMELEAFLLGGLHDAVANQPDKIVSLTENRCDDPSGCDPGISHCPHRSFIILSTKHSADAMSIHRPHGVCQLSTFTSLVC